ncbi:MAG: hypothetical protein LCI00_11420 [Chloroflexi bacterium]|nr:hypothetical protein [Chloroflexota bacterium]
MWVGGEDAQSRVPTGVVIGAWAHSRAPYGECEGESACGLVARTRCLASLQAWSGVWGWWAHSRAPYGECEGESACGLVARTRCLASLQA